MLGTENDRVQIPKWLLTVAIAIAGWALSAYVGYAAALSSMNARVSVLEDGRTQIERRLTSIDGKIDQLLLRRP